MEYTNDEKIKAQQLRIIFAIYKQGWEDAMQSMRLAQHAQFNSLNNTIAWLNEVPTP